MSDSNGIDRFTDLELDMIDSHIQKTFGESRSKINIALRLVDALDNRNKQLKKLVLDLVSAIENGVEDQEIKYAEKVVNDNEELIKEIRN